MKKRNMLRLIAWLVFLTALAAMVRHADTCLSAEPRMVPSGLPASQNVQVKKRADNSITLAKPIGKEAAEDWVYLDNGQIRLGALKTSGAAIGYLVLSGSTRNLLNHIDHGRLVQQSYYGDPDGSMWDKKPWRWNPVQGGDWQGGSSKLLEIRAERTALYAKIQPRHWAACVELPDVTMEERIELAGRGARTFTSR